jgi:hypothetical protein
VRLFLDAHISGPRIAQVLREAGHDVRAADEERGLDGLTDEQLLALAAEEERIFVTFDAKDFPMIARRWAEAGRAHAGCAIVVGLDHGEFGAILRTLAAQLAARPRQADWRELTLFVARMAAGILLPGRCPREGFRFVVHMAFQDGAAASGGTAVACPHPPKR